MRRPVRSFQALNIVAVGHGKAVADGAADLSARGGRFAVGLPDERRDPPGNIARGRKARRVRIKEVAQRLRLRRHAIDVREGQRASLPGPAAARLLHKPQAADIFEKADGVPDAALV